jgi:ABC-2 type transport system permease protein
VISSQTETLGGWSREELLLIGSSWTLNNGIAYMFFYSNMKKLVKDIMYGRLDFALLKPIDSQFSPLLNRFNFAALFSLIQGTVVIIYVFLNWQRQPELTHIVGFLMLTICAALLYYTLWFVAATLSFYFVQTDNLIQIVPEFVELSKFPGTAYPPEIALFLSSILPIILLTTRPVQQLLGHLTIWGFLYTVVICLLFVILSRIFWQRSLKRYTSAS